MCPQSSLQDPFSYVNDTVSTSSSFGYILHPQPRRPIPRSLAREADWRALAPRQDDRTHFDEDSYSATYFPDPDNSLGLFSTDPKHSVAPSGHPGHLPTRPTLPKIQDYEREGGWSFDAMGRTHYVPHGGIVAVDENEGNLDIGQDSHTAIDQELPPDSTPPPRPRQRPVPLIPLPLLDDNPLGPRSDEPYPRICPPSTRDLFISVVSHGIPTQNSDQWLLPDDTTSAHAEQKPPIDRPPLGDESNTRFNDLPPPRSFRSNHGSTNRRTRSPSTMLTRSQEFNAAEKALASITTASLEIVSLHNTLGALPKPNAADGTLCDRVGKMLHAVEESLRRHRVVPADQWNLRSVSCRRKYDTRIKSLQRTLSRLHNLSVVSPRVNQIHKVRKLLQQHLAKLSDLATKFNDMFDRLDDRIFNGLLAGMRAEYQRGVAARKEDRKAARSARLGPYEYALHRLGRRPSLVGAS
ncbi:hypothetical protein MSAN_01651500 [Mycena sanguinolenta]|uniref:Uncharacterized protein n=1 Tax=Mycena sanguinolenta TaxID=230812 RepID=A0A8H6Y1W4_9AGAR|nr:hypothetical protein MSAN_01651500 [Mycena sanguinolenta]